MSKDDLVDSVILRCPRTRVLATRNLEVRVSSYRTPRIHEPPRHIRLSESRRARPAPPVSFSVVRTATHSCIRPFICRARLTLKAFYHRSSCVRVYTHARARAQRAHVGERSRVQSAREKGKSLRVLRGDDRHAWLAN